MSVSARVLVGLRVVLVALVVWLAGTLVVDYGVEPSERRSWGWDETMHAELPAVRMVLHAQEGEWWRMSRVAHSCNQYPFLYPMVLGAWHAVFGLGEAAARALGLVLFLLVVLGTARLAQQVGARSDEPPPRFTGGGWALDAALLGAVLALSSPLARRYAPTTFLEVPCLVVIVWALDAWVARRRTRPHTARADLVAGLWLAAAFFTKFNYALLLFAAVGLDALVELARARGSVAALWSLVRVALPLSIGLTWWFVWPFPFGEVVAAAHRGAFADFIGGNRHMNPMAGWLRATNWLTGVAAHSFVFATLVASSVVFVVVRRTPAAWTLGCALVAFTIPVIAHPFQLDRFLLPAALVLWVVGAAAWARVMNRWPVTFSLSALGLLLACTAVSNFRTTWWVGFPVAPEDTPSRRFQEHHVEVTLGVFGPRASNGLLSSTHDDLLDMVAEGVGPTATVGWLGQSSEMSPAALHLGLLERGGDARRFLEDAHRPMDIEPIPSDRKIEHSADELVAFARRFDHVLLASTGDLKDRKFRGWIRNTWHRPLLESGEVDVRDLGTIFVARPIKGPMPIVIRMVTPR